MKLTNKAKEDFEKWLEAKGLVYLYNWGVTTTNNALIIEWFDSVGIEIFPHSGWSYATQKRDGIDVEIIHDEYRHLIFDNQTRVEATEKGIEKANEIYNNLNK